MEKKYSIKKKGLSYLLFIDYERGVIFNVFIAIVSGVLLEIGNIGGGRGCMDLEEKVMNSVLDVSSFLLK